MEMKSCRLGDIAFITKLAGFEHTKYIQGNCVREKVDDTFIPLFIGKTIRDGKIDTNFDWYISKKIADKLPRSFLKRKCLVLPYVGSLGDLAIFDASYEALLGSNVAKIELNQDCEFTEEFIYYFLKSPYGQSVLLKDEQGGIQKNITMESIRNVILPDISVSNQKKITDVLSALDDKIALNQQINRNLEELARLIYDYWFVQFDFPDKNGKPYKTSGGKMVYNDQLKREIPEGWEVVKFEDFIEIGNGKDHSHLPSGEIPVYGSGGFMRGVTEYLFEGESVLFPRKGTLNNVMYKNEKFWTVDTMFYSRMKMPKTAIYVYYAAKKFDFTTMNTGTGVPSMTSIIIKALPIIRPPQAIIEKFDSVAQSFYRSMLKTEKEIAKLTTLRDQLLPLLMNGQVSVEKQP